MNSDDIDLNQLSKSSIELAGRVSGVYFLFDGDELVYIGQGWNCFLRVAEHTRKDKFKKFTSWNFVPIESEKEYKALEKELIRRYQPKLNRQYKSA